MPTTTDKLPSSVDLKYPAYMVFCVVVASLGFFCSGWVTGSANLPGAVTHACANGNSHTVNSLFPDCLPMNDAMWGFAVASFCIGGLMGGITAGHIQTKFGRRKTTMFNGFGYIVGGLLIGCSVNPAMFIIGRILCGYSCGVTSLTTPIYVGEISTIKVRGSLNLLYQIMMTIAILVSSLVGVPLSYVPLWRINYAIVAIPAMVTTILMFFCVESPRYLVSVNKIEEAKSSLQKLRPNSDISTELYEIIRAQLGASVAHATMDSHDDPKSYMEAVYMRTNDVAEVSHDQKLAEEEYMGNSHDTHSERPSEEGEELGSAMNVIEVWKDPFIRKVLFIVISLNAFQQVVGINAIMYYSTTMFNQLFDSELSKYLAIACTGVNFVATVISFFLVDTLGRRILLISSVIGTCLFSVTLTLGYVFNIGPLMIVSVFCFIVVFEFGIGPIAWMYMSEISPVYASSSIGAIGVTVNWAMNFLVGQCFPVIFSRIHGYSFLIFAAISAIAAIVIFFKVPETKGRSIEDIVKEFKLGTL